jgi:hypothetical protein
MTTANTATAPELTPEQVQANIEKMFPEYELPKAIKQTADNLNALVTEAIEKSGGSVIKALKQVKEYVSTLNGDTEKKKRINHMAALLRVDPERLKEGKSTVARIELAMTALLEGRDPREEVQLHAAISVEKEAKVKEAGELVTYLKGAEMTAPEVSGTMSNLTGEDIKTFTSSVFAAYNAGIAWFTKKHKMPSAAEKALQWLLGAASGKTEFSATNEFIAAAANVSTKQVSRNVQALAEFMKESGFGLVSIKQVVKKPTEYKLHLLDVMQALIQNVIVSGDASAKTVLAIAGASGQLLTEGATAASLQMDEESFKTAKNLAEEMESTLNDFPQPSVKLAEGGEGNRKTAIMSQITKMRTVAGALGEQANEAGLSEEDQNAIGQIAVQLRSAETQTEAGKPVDLAPIQTVIDQFTAKVKEALQTETAAASEELETAKAEGKATPQLYQDVAEKQVAEYPESDLEANAAAAFENIQTELYELAAICNRIGGDAGTKRVVELHGVIKSAFNTAV